MLPMVARVLTFYSEKSPVGDLVATLRATLPAAYEPMPGFRGLLVLEKPDRRHHVIAVSLWEDEPSLKASELAADEHATRIAAAAGNCETRNVYNVLGKIGILESV